MGDTGADESGTDGVGGSVGGGHGPSLADAAGNRGRGAGVVEDMTDTTTTRAVLGGVVIAESDDITEVEGRVYFPLDAVDMSRLAETDTSTRCSWKGTARYWDVEAGGEIAADGAFAYPEPSEKAAPIVTDRIAFWNGVEVDQG